MLAARSVQAGLIQSRQECPDIGGRAHHLVGSGQVRPTAKAENRRDLLPRGQQVEKDLLVGRVGGEDDASSGVKRVAGEEVRRQTIQLVHRSSNRLAALLDVATECKR